MTETHRPSPTMQLVIFGGYRTETIEDSLAAETFLRVHGCGPSDCYANVWEGDGDSLHRRWERSVQWLDTQAGQDVVFHILGYSMGCQLATRFARDVLSRAGRQFRLGSLTLVAPDPKFRGVSQDDAERRHGMIPAFDEASELWSKSDSAGPAFIEALRQVADACDEPCRIIFCKADAVAEWSDNVEIMARELHGHAKIRWLETLLNEEVSKHGLRVRLDPNAVSHIDCADPVHAALWYRLTFEA